MRVYEVGEDRYLEPIQAHCAARLKKSTVTARWYAPATEARPSGTEWAAFAVGVDGRVCILSASVGVEDLIRRGVDVAEILRAPAAGFGPPEVEGVGVWSGDIKATDEGALDYELHGEVEDLGVDLTALMTRAPVIDGDYREDREPRRLMIAATDRVLARQVCDAAADLLPDDAVFVGTPGDESFHGAEVCLEVERFEDSMESGAPWVRVVVTVNAFGIEGTTNMPWPVDSCRVAEVLAKVGILRGVVKVEGFTSDDRIALAFCGQPWAEDPENHIERRCEALERRFTSIVEWSTSPVMPWAPWVGAVK